MSVYDRYASKLSGGRSGPTSTGYSAKEYFSQNKVSATSSLPKPKPVGRPFGDVGKGTISLVGLADEMRRSQTYGVQQPPGQPGHKLFGGDIGQTVGDSLDLAWQSTGAWGGPGGMWAHHQFGQAKEFAAKNQSDFDNYVRTQGYDPNTVESVNRNIYNDFWREDFVKKGGNALFSDFIIPRADASALDGLAMTAGFLLGAPQRLLTRALAGTGSRVKDLKEATDEQLEGQLDLIHIRDMAKSGQWQDDRVLDELAKTNYGLWNPMGQAEGIRHLRSMGGAGQNPLSTVAAESLAFAISLGGTIGSDPLSWLSLGSASAIKLTATGGLKVLQAVSDDAAKAALRVADPTNVMRAAGRDAVRSEAVAAAQKQVYSYAQREGILAPTEAQVVEAAMRNGDPLVKNAMRAAGYRQPFVANQHVVKWVKKVDDALNPLTLFSEYRKSAGLVTRATSIHLTSAFVETVDGGAIATAQRALAGVGVTEDQFGNDMGTAIQNVANQIGTEAVARSTVVLGQSPTNVGTSALLTDAGKSWLEKHGADAGTMMKHKVDKIRELFIPQEGESLAQMVQREREAMAPLVAAMYNIGQDKAATALAKMGEKELIAVRFLGYGRMTEDLLDARTLAIQQSIAKGLDPDFAERFIFFGPTQLDLDEARNLRAAISRGDVNYLRSAIQRWDVLEFNIPHNLHDRELAMSVSALLDAVWDQLPKAIPEDALTPAMQDFITKYDGFAKVGLKPEIPLQTVLDRNQRVIAVDPFADYVSSTYIGRLPTPTKAQVTKQALLRKISGAQVVNDQKRRFVQAMGQSVGMPREWSESLFSALNNRAAMGTMSSMRGLSPEEVHNVLKEMKFPEEMLTKATKREMQLAIFWAMKGDTAKVGLTQAFTGGMKNFEVRLTGAVRTAATGTPMEGTQVLATMADKLYPLLRFKVNPAHIAQDAFESPFLLMARGYTSPTQLVVKPYKGIRGVVAALSPKAAGQRRATLRRHVTDPKAAELARLTANLMDAFSFGTRTAQDTVEATAVVRAGAAAASRISGSGEGRMLQKLTEDRLQEGIKTRGQLIAFRKELGKSMGTIMQRESPAQWQAIKTFYRTNDNGEAAVRWFNDAMARSNPESAFSAVKASGDTAAFFRPSFLGQRSRFSPVIATEALSIGIPSVEKKATWSSLRSRYADAGDADVTEETVTDALRAMGADEDYIQRTKWHLGYDTPEAWEKQLADLTDPATARAHMRMYEIEAAHQGVPVMELLADRHAGAPLSIDELGNRVDNTLFQLISDTLDNRGLTVPVADHADIIPGGVVAQSGMRVMPDMVPPETGGVSVLWAGRPEAPHVEMVPLSALSGVASSGRGAMPDDEWTALKASTSKEVKTKTGAKATIRGLSEPLRMDWSPVDNTVKWGEGDVRIAALLESVPVEKHGETYVPVYINTRNTDALAGSPSPSKLAPDEGGYIPPMVRPSDIGYGTAESAATIKREYYTTNLVKDLTDAQKKGRSFQRARAARAVDPNLGTPFAVGGAPGGRLTGYRRGAPRGKDFTMPQRAGEITPPVGQKAYYYIATDADDLMLTRARGVIETSRLTTTVPPDDMHWVEVFLTDSEYQKNIGVGPNRLSIPNEPWYVEYRKMTGTSGPQTRTEFMQQYGSVLHEDTDIGKAARQRLRDLQDRTEGDIVHRIGKSNNPEEVVNEYMAVMTYDELVEYSQWYPQMRRAFHALSDGDAQKATKYLIAFGVTQLNTSPIDGMKFMLRVMHRMESGATLPDVEDVLKQVAGLNGPLLLKLLKQYDDGIPLTTEGLGQKLVDFIDSLLGSTTRTVPVSGPKGTWGPVAGDIWAMRDAGFIDGKMYNHLVHAYGEHYDIAKVDPKMVKNAQGEMEEEAKGFLFTDRSAGETFNIKVTGSSPTDLEYDYLVEYYNNIATYMNEIEFLGRTNWQGAEAQSLGWFKAKRVFGDDTGDPAGAFGASTWSSNTAMEQLPTRAYPADGYPQLSRETSRQVAQRIATPLVDEASHISGVRVIGMRESVTFDEATGKSIASTNVELFTDNEGAETHAAVQGIIAKAPRVRVTKRTQTRPTTANITRDGVEFSFPSDWTDQEVLAIAEELAEKDEFFRDADLVLDDNENHVLRVVARQGEGIGEFQARKSDADLMNLWQEHVGEEGYPRGRYVDPEREAGIRSMGEDIVTGSYQNQSRPTAILDNVDAVLQKAWDSTHKTKTGKFVPDSGMTLDAHTGTKPKARGRRSGGGPYVTAVGHTISVPVGATREEFDAALRQFLDVSEDDLSRSGAALGVFHNKETNSIDFDANLVVNTYEEAEALQLYLGRHGGAFNLTMDMARVPGAASAERNVFRPIFDPQKAFGFERIYADTIEVTNDWAKYPNGEQYREVLNRPTRGDTPKGGTSAPVRPRQNIIDQLDDEVDTWATMVREDAYQNLAPRELAALRESRRIDAEPGYALDANGRSDYLDSVPRGRRGTLLAAADARRSGALYQRTAGGAPRGAITDPGGAVSTTGRPARIYLSPRRLRKDTVAHEEAHDYVGRFLQPSGIRRVKQIHSGRTGRALDAADHRSKTLTIDEQEWLADQFVEYLRQGPDAMADPTLVPLAEHYAQTLTDRAREAAPLTPETIAYNAAEVRYQRALAQHESDKTVHDAAEMARFDAEQKAYDEAVAAQAAAPTPAAAAAPPPPAVKSPELIEAEDQASAIGAVFSKWDERGTKNAAQMRKDLDRLEAADIDVGEQMDMLDDYESIERGDFSEASEYGEYRQAAWDDLMDSLNTKAETHVEDTGLLDEVEEPVLRLDSSGPIGPDIEDVPPEHAPRDILMHYDKGRPGISYAHDNVNERDVIVIFRDDNGMPQGYVRMDSGNTAVKPSTKGRVGGGVDTEATITPGPVDTVHVYVKPGARRQGVATKLYDWVERRGWELNPEQSLTAEGRAFYASRAAPPPPPVGTSAAPPPPLPVAPTPIAPYAGAAPAPLGPRPPQAKTQVRELSPEAKELFDQMAQRKPTGRKPYGFDVDEEAMMQWLQVAHRRADRMASDLIHFKGERSWLERSLNHPFFGLYPLSYMWGKILPEMVEFLAFRPFGMKTPLIGYDLTQQLYQHMMLQQEFDPELREFMAKHENAWRALSMFVPGLPWDLPVNTPLWARRYFEAVATNLSADQAGMKPENYGAWNAFVSDVDLARVTLETASYASPVYSATQLAKIPGMVADLGEPSPEELAQREAEAAAEEAADTGDWDFFPPTTTGNVPEPAGQPISQGPPVLAQQEIARSQNQPAEPGAGYEEPQQEGSIGELADTLGLSYEDVLTEISE